MDAIHASAREGEMNNLLKCIDGGVSVNLKDRMKKMGQSHRRGKLELKLIENEKHRMVTFKKRRANLVKKVSELKTLCGISICLVIAGPKTKKVNAANNEGQQVEGLEVETWPQDAEELRSVIHKYRSTDRRRFYYVPDYFADKKQAINAERNKLRQQISNSKYPQWDDRLDNSSLEQLKTLITLLDTKLGDVDRRLASMLLNSSNNNNNQKQHHQLYYSCGYGNALDDTAASELQLFSIPRPLDFRPPEPGTPFHPRQLQGSQMTPPYLVSNSISIQTNHNHSINIDRQLFSDNSNRPNNHLSASFQQRHSSYYKEASSSLNPVSNEGNNSKMDGHSLADPHLFSSPKSFDFQLPKIDRQDSQHITPLHRHSSIGDYSTYNYNFSQPSNFYVQLPFQFEQNSCLAPLDSNIEDTLLKMMSDQNTGNHFGDRPSNKDPSMPRNRLPTLSAWDDASGIYQSNVVSSNSNILTPSIDFSGTNPIIPITRPGALQMQMPLPTSSNNPTPSSQENAFDDNLNSARRMINQDW